MADYKLSLSVQGTYATEVARDTAYNAVKAACDGITGSTEKSGRGRKWTEDTETVDQLIVTASESENL